MGNLHQLLAVKKDLSHRANQIVGETGKTLAKKHYFQGSLRTYEPFEEEGELTEEAQESESLAYTVGEKLGWFAEEFGRLIDCEYQIDLANQAAIGEVRFDEKPCFLPAPFLLDLIGLLEKVKHVYTQAQVLDPKLDWILAEQGGDGVYRADPDGIDFRTRKTLRHKVLVPATEQHPAQVEKWNEDERIGKYIKRHWSGALTAHQKALVLGRIDTLIVKTRQALAKANETEHSTDKIAERIFKWLHRDIPLGGVARDGADSQPQSDDENVF